MSDTPMPGNRPRKPLPRPDTDPTSDVLPREELLGDLAGYDSQGTDLMPLPEGALDDLPPASSPSSWLGREPLARDESDVIRGLTQQPPPPGSSNIFDTGPDGSSRFHLSRDGTDHLTGEQPRPSNDVLYADLGNPAAPSSVVFSGDDLFDRPGLSGRGRPAGDSDPGMLPGGGDSGSGSSGGPNFNATSSGDDDSNLFADPTAADLDLDGEGVPLGTDPQSDADLARTGPGSSIFAGGLGPQGSALDVDRIPIMASNDEGRGEDLGFDAPPPSGIGHDIFGPAGKPARPSGLGAVAFDLPHAASNDPNATERSDGGVSWDLPDADAAPGHVPMSQKSRRMTAEESTELPGGALPTVRRTPAQVTGRAPVVDVDPPRRPGRGGWLGGGLAGLAAGAGATAAGLYLGGFLGADSPKAAQPSAMVQTAADPAPDRPVGGRPQGRPGDPHGGRGEGEGGRHPDGHRPGRNPAAPRRAG